MIEIIFKIVMYAIIAFVFSFAGARIALKMERSTTDIHLKYLVAESELERLLNERDKARTELYHLRCKYEGSEVDES